MPGRRKRLTGTLFTVDDNVAQSIFVQISIRSIGAEGFQRATGKPFGRLRRGEIPCETEKARKHLISCGNFHPQQGGRRFPKGDRKALWSPPQRRNPAKRKKQGSIFSLLSISNLLLVGGFVRLRADEVLSPRGKVPKGRRRLRIRQRRIRRSQSDLAFAKRKPTLGGQRVHAAWPPPDPPLLSYSAPLASQGRAQLGSRPSLGGPLSPSRLAFTL